MDFISNLIKRPISLVRSESLSSDQGQANSRPITPQHSPSLSQSPLSPFDRAIIPETHQQPIASTLNGPLISANVMDMQNVQNDFHPITTAPTTRTSPPISQSGSQTFSSSLQTSASSHGSDRCDGNILNPVNTDGNTIEELLIQINDNLNMGDLLHTDTELNQHTLPNRPLSLSPTAFAKALSSEYNAISSKSANLKESSSTQYKESSSSAPSSLKTSAMAPVADSASATLIASEKERCIAESKAGTLDVAVPAVSLKADIHIDKDKSFPGAAADASGTKVVEMPTALNINTEDRAKLTFEDGLIPTLTAAINEREKSSSAAGKDESNARHNLQPPMEPDTATSSDNETFAECETDQISTSNNDYGFIADEYSFENSEVESYFSAANSRNVTIRNDEADPLSLNVTFDEEPMDVDISCTEIKEHLNVELTQVTTPLGTALKTVTHENVVTTIPSVECKPETSNKSETLKSNTTTAQHETSVETTQSEVEVTLNRTDELPTSTAQNHSIEHKDIDSSTTETASEVTADLSRNTITSPISVYSANTSLQPIEESGMKHSSFENKQENQKSLTGSHNALNLTTDMNSSTSSSKSSASSPSFPIKQKGISLKQFPRSPVADAPKKIPFLEKSEYTERIETERKKSVANDPKFALPGSRKTSSIDDRPAQLAKSEMVAANTERYAACSKDNLNEIVASVKTNGSTTTESDIPTKHAELCESLDKRRTFNITPPVSEDTENVRLKHISDEDKRRTYNIPSEQMNVFSLKSDREVDKQRTFDMPAVPAETDTANQKYVSDEGNNRRTFNLECSEKNNDKLEEKSSSGNDVDEIPRTYIISEPVTLATTSNNFPKPEEIDEPMDLDETLPMESAKSLPTPIQSPPTTTISSSPPIPTLQNRSASSLDKSPTLSSIQNHRRDENVTNLKMDDEAFRVPLPPSPSSSTASPPKPTIQKRPSIHAYKNAEDTVTVEALSAKEQTKRDSSDEKDVFAGTNTPSPMEDQPSSTSGFGIFGSDLNVDADQQEYTNEQFFCGNNLILNPSDFDYLLTKGNNSAPVDRNSLLLKFDPLLGVPVPANQIQQQQNSVKQSSQILQNILGNNNKANLSPTIEEDEHSTSSASVSSINNNQSCADEADNKRSPSSVGAGSDENFQSKHNLHKNSTEKQQNKEQQLPQQQPQTKSSKKHASMSVDVIKDMNIDNDCNKTFENSNSQPDEKQINYKMDELEKKIKNEVLKTEDIEKKLKEAEQREEALIKRITEKDKTITKMTGVIEAYEKAIAELIAEKEQLLQGYEKQLAEVKADRDSNYQHLTSLETTFADLHVKYGKSKEMTLQLKSNEEALVAEKRQILENLRLQEQRYDKMKNHAMQQLEIANKKLESLNKEHSIETTKLKALLKKEEISRASINEQLQQKSRENAELVKICDELISGSGS
ncbi:transforming acidic coiled-coil-containing protein 2 isoform X2 [Ceratitis capitata]|uniref:transforming acidic coiled-coil-containing protein 2 isoform X2 n=1 Tax=Ceratitis capitata TaxID=7213 RepID=UPI000329FF4B|nr:transforming acidic coiled-coil-containing protein 2 isoform X2 [Ceratitis capitata]